MVVKGKVTYNDLEGGFWGIVTDEDEQLRPVDGLPTSLQRAGCRIEADVEPSSGISIFMWGRPVKVRSIRQIESNG
ncbi:MAG: hypothetical protein KDD65_13060 [Bacteroidetes bacterium]|nr:hypothetical protein [Bacteroidota bacterium]